MSDHAHNRKRLSSKVIWGGMGTVLLLLGIAPVLTYLVWSSGHARRAQTFLERIEAAGEPISADDLPSSFPLESGAEDCAELWMAGLNALDTPENQAAMKKLPMMRVGNTDSAPSFSEPWLEMADSEKFLDSNSLALDKFHDACQRGGYAKFPVDFSKGNSTPPPYAEKMRLAGRLLRLELEVKARNHDTAGASKALQSLLIASRSVENEPSSYSQFDGLYLDYLAHQALAEKLCLVPFSEEDLREFQSRLRTKSLAKSVRMTLQAERAMVYSKLKLPLAKRPMQADIACLLEFTQRYLEANDKPFPEKMKLAIQIDADLKARCSESLAVVTLRYSSQSGALYRTTVEASATLTSTLQAAEAGIAVERYRREHGKLPDTLETLTPKYLASVPLDPWSGKPMLLKAEERGFTIYGVGRNKVDDDGRLDLETGDEGLFFPLK